MAASTKEEPLSPGSRLFQAPRLNLHIIVIMGSKTKINASVIKAGLEQTLIKHPRFSSKLASTFFSSLLRWIPTKVNIEDHVIVPELDLEMDSPNQFVEDYISNLTTMPMDISKPLWEVHILNVKTSEADAVGVLRIHHSIGDGVSLMSLLLACTRKTSNPEALPTLPVQNRKSTSSVSGGFWSFFVIWSTLRIFFNTIVNIVVFMATILFLKDSKSPIYGTPGIEHNPKRFVHKTFCLNDIKLVKNAMNMTVNDVLTGVTQADLSRYLNRIYANEYEKDGVQKQKANNLPKRIRLTAIILVNTRPTAGIQALADMMAKNSKANWGSQIGYIIVPFTIALQDDPVDYVRGAKTIVDRKKQSLEVTFTSQLANFVQKTFGDKAAAALLHRVVSNTTLAFSNMVGPQEEIIFYGHTLAYIAPSVYGHPHALTIHVQSYINNLTICLAVDPSLIPDPHQLCADFEESLNIIKNAVLEKGLIKEIA
ncbi:LOW QUALITY PROTEIN: WES_acyltransf domain-containing protein/DUF1298 domain-containing protein [Cephalotus follicularis]|uniref:WES_acyltransf domain-containing protein/DUF1298 domain-containing protein n=1 Tax=Cephalotus follicularis TaxID=3775 RepID=A0A1Q3BEF0_CEPFO|nr:LOW QUALITY PROTEIN: WES_acyltransf domain-containing protein/DUF1298 domain-containing protein [Cephalotus follicularis]